MERDPKKLVGVGVLLVTYAILSVIAVYCVFFSRSAPSPAVGVAAIIGMAALSLVALVVSGQDIHVRANTNNRTLDLASQTVTFMREGLSQESAQAVCDLLLTAVTACSVAITNRTMILGFSGVDRKNHEQGTPIQTVVTLDTLEDGQTRVVETANALGFKGDGAKIKGAIIVPLVVRENIVGTLKFYYTSASRMDEDQLAMAEGFAQLLSTQLSLSYLEQQAELAARMELKALQAQINPHFLFNTINTIASYTRTDPTKARTMLREFAVYYRRLLENSEDLIPLASEIEQTERYLMFQRARFGEDSVQMQISDLGELGELRVPAFILQPLVENAVGHGRRPDGSTLHIAVTVTPVGDDAVISVTDDGVGIPPERLATVVDGGSKTGMGIALKNVNARLKGYFGSLSGLSIQSVEGEGTTVVLLLSEALSSPEHEAEELSKGDLDKLLEG
ncbi:MAG: histidine kinase [Coriobacteriales bacterium]|nr:histidine kinase [Coriobacteriaceae bacterium]MDD6768484.1 histidine kinase [Coriobacteriaceae bacterium]